MIKPQQALPDAIIIIGPTGSGKTPLGELLEKTGLNHRKCFHFDFGNSLRRYSNKPDGSLRPDELQVVNDSLYHGTLLEDHHFSIADKLLCTFINRNIRKPGDTVIMNGLPRHTGQAEALQNRINVKAQILLECTPETVLERIKDDTGGDRGSREDDNLEEIKKRLNIFYKRTLPLIDYYRKGGTLLIKLPVSSLTTAEESLFLLNLKAESF